MKACLLTVSLAYYDTKSRGYENVPRLFTVKESYQQSIRHKINKENKLSKGNPMDSKLAKLVINLAIPLVVGAFSVLISSDTFSAYRDLEMPMFAPPAIVFPIVWTILYILMGVSTYLISSKNRITDSSKMEAYFIYAIQLGLNFLWTPVFFVLENRIMALIILVFLICAVVKMIMKFTECDVLAGRLQIPYLIWCIFAFYLNCAIVILN